MKNPPPLLVALGVVSGNNRLLVIETSPGRLELLGVASVKEEQATSQISQLISELGLEQSPQKTLYLPQLKDPKAPKKSGIGVIHLVHLAKGRRIELPNSRFEQIQKLAVMTEASLMVRAVAQWLLQTQA